MIEIYADGSGTSLGLPGGWGFVVVIQGNKMHEDSGSLKNATNNVAELTAAIKGLEYIKNDPELSQKEIVLVSDSKLTLGFASGEFMVKAPNLIPLYIELRKLYKSMNVQTRWVKGHSGDEHNERCDKLAKSAREELLNVKTKSKSK